MDIPRDNKRVCSEIGHFPNKSDRRYWRAGCQETGTSSSGEGGRKSTTIKRQLVGLLSHTTYIWTQEGWLYFAVVLDLFSRRVVGWSMSQEMTAQLVTDALVMAVWRRGRPKELLHHSDQGSQYTSEQFQTLLAELGITCSMSRRGDVWDNSAMESFFSSLKTERVSRKVY